MVLYIIYQVQMHPNVSKEPNFDAKKNVRNHHSLGKRANPNIGTLLLQVLSLSLEYFLCSFFVYSNNIIIFTIFC